MSFRNLFVKSDVKSNVKIALLMLFCTASCLSFGYAFKPLHLLTLFLLLLVVSSASTLIYKILIIIITVISAAYLPVGLTYGPPDFNSAVSLFYTDSKESLGFIEAISWFYYLGSVLVIMLAIPIMDIKINKLKYRKLIALYLVVSFSSTPLRLYAHDGNIKPFSSGIPVVHVVASTIENYREVEIQNAMLVKSLATPDDWAPQEVSTPYQLYIMVIGESVRSDYMNAYGFPVSNTPFMSSASGEIFTHYISAASSTQTSLKNSLALHRNLQAELNNNIITLANKAGFATYWYSNQGSLGVHDTPVASIGKHAGHSFFLKKGDSWDDGTLADTDLLTKIEKGINERKKTQLIVIHLMGSHPEACVRTKGEYKEFLQSREISCYNQSIRKTDKLLSDVANMAKASGKKWSMIYFADHGLSFENADTQYARLLHGDQHQQNYTVPLFITSSDSTRRITHSQPRSALNFLTLFTQWIGIKDNLIQDSCDMRSEAVCDEQDTVIKFDSTKAQFSTLPADIAAH